MSADTDKSWDVNSLYPAARTQDPESPYFDWRHLSQEPIQIIRGHSYITPLILDGEDRISLLKWAYRNWGTETPISGDELARLDGWTYSVPIDLWALVLGVTGVRA